MRQRQKIAPPVILILVLAAAYGYWQTRPTPTPSTARPAKLASLTGKALVDQSPLKTAQQLAQLATAPEEKALAKEVLRLADLDVNIAFENAIRQARLHPPPLSAEAKEAKERQQKAEAVLETAQERAKQLSEQLARAPESRQDRLQEDLIQAEADVGLASSEVDDARQDLLRAGGDLVGRLQALEDEHKQTSNATASALTTGPESPDQPGLIHRVMQWRDLHKKQMQLWQALTDTEAALADLLAKHNALDAQVDAEKAAVPQLAHHSKKNRSAASGAPASVPPAEQSPMDAATLLKKTQELADNQKVLSAFDERIDTKKELASIYVQWIGLVANHQRAVLHQALLGAVIILVIALIVMFFSSWTDSLVKRLRMDRRQIESLRTVARVALQVLALFLILLMIFGPPGQLGTVLGLAGAGLTVALKDFIVAFIGWFVLMGKNGIRLGDWVEIKGVTGEVVEIGPFHTVLMETGNWTDSGHPTGRRVTFTNSFAIEGHYFNFSTSGQWLWDELSVVLPADKDPYPLIDAIQKKVAEVTREGAQQAEREWRSATSSRDLSGISVEPAISVKPVIGGIEVAVRYITRASERYVLRAKLNQAAVELLGGKVQRAAS